MLSTGYSIWKQREPNIGCLVHFWQWEPSNDWKPSQNNPRIHRGDTIRHHVRRELLRPHFVGARSGFPGGLEVELEDGPQTAENRFRLPRKIRKSIVPPVIDRRNRRGLPATRGRFDDRILERKCDFRFRT